MSIQKRFKPEDLERIKAAVKQAESKISGEIVPFFVEKSSHYTLANYKAAVMGAALVFFLIILFDRYVPSIAVYDPVLIFALVVAGGFLGALKANYISFVKRLMLSQSYMDQATHRRAQSAFLQEEVFNTNQRTGIMIFISFFEHEVIILADKGISKVVDQKEWDLIVRTIIDHVKKDKIAEGIEKAILRCGEILLEKGFVNSPDDINELKDDLRIE
jgi:putative membrane protein